MGDQSAIEWTDATWNPIVGCSRVSEGCRHCYAERQAFRAAAMGISRYDGITKKVGDEIRWTGTVALVESALDLPLRWRQPRRIFVNSMSDLFHEAVPDEWILRILEVIERATQHTFQVLTKRPQRMLDFFIGSSGAGASAPVLSNLWLGVSVEDQASADARIPLLLQAPAAVRWVSYEPALGRVDFTRIKVPKPEGPLRPINPTVDLDVLRGTRFTEMGLEYQGLPRLDWIVVGGESGPGARPFDVEWARETIEQAREASVPVFVKQLGATAFEEGRSGECSRLWLKLQDRKGGDPAEWPEDLRVREYAR